jgi:hypothetical protein
MRDLSACAGWFSLSRIPRKSSSRKRHGYALVFVFGALSLLLIALLGQLSLHLAGSSLAFTRMKLAVGRADARFALNQALAGLAQWPGMDACATAPGDMVSGSAQPRWTFCTKADGSRAYLVSTLPMDSHVAADVLMAGAEDSSPAVYVPAEGHADSSGRTYVTTAWWADDLGVKAPVASTDGREDERLFRDLSFEDAAEMRTFLKQQIPGPYMGGDTSYTARRSAFVLSNAYDGGLREDLSALVDGGVEASGYAHQPSAGEVAWMRLQAPVGGTLSTDPAGARMEPVVTEFLLACGLGANSAQYKPLNLSQSLDILLAYHVYVEVWNPYTRAMDMGVNEDIRVVVRGLPTVSGSSLGEPPVISLPSSLTAEFDCRGDLVGGIVQLLASPVSEGGTYPKSGVWLEKVGSIVTNKFNYGKHVTLHFTSASPTVEFYDVKNPSPKPFFTLKLENYGAFDMVYGDGTAAGQFFRNPGLMTSFGMCRATINGGGWAFAYHMRLRDEDLAALLRRHDPRNAVVELDASSGGDEYHEVLRNPTQYDNSYSLRDSDFFATLYRGYSATNRQAFLADPPASTPISFVTLRHAPSEGRAAFAVGAGILPDADAELDRYFFSTLPDGAWDGSFPIANFRLIPAMRDATILRGKDDAAGLLLKGGFNVNATSGAAWRAVLATLEWKDWTLYAPSGTTNAMQLAVPLFSLPWTAAHPPTAAACDALVDGDAPAWENGANQLYENRKHPAFLSGFRDIGPYADALAEEIANRICARAIPFRSLTEFAQSRIVQDSIDAVAAINHRAGSSDAIPRGSPVNVEQGALLCALSPMLFTRSDTFRVRACGRDEKTGTEIWCEAVVQRLPEAVDGDAALYGRRFKVMSVRRLSPLLF